MASKILSKALKMSRGTWTQPSWCPRNGRLMLASTKDRLLTKKSAFAHGHFVKAPTLKKWRIQYYWNKSQCPRTNIEPLDFSQHADSAGGCATLQLKKIEKTAEKVHCNGLLCRQTHFVLCICILPQCKQTN